MLKTILYQIFPFLKLKMSNLKWHKKLSIYFEIIIMLWFFAWLFILFLYHFNFQDKYTYRNINLYTKTIINCFQIDMLTKNMLNIETTLKKHKIMLKTLRSDIYIINNDSEYFIIMPPFSIIKYIKTMAFATLDQIYFKYVNLYDNKSYSSFDKTHSESFELVLSHELTHVWQEKNYGFFRFLLLSDWVKEGYAVYVTEHIKKENINFLNSDFKYLDDVELYALWGLMNKHAIEHMHKSVDDLHLGKVRYDEVMESLLKEYNLSKE